MNSIFRPAILSLLVLGVACSKEGKESDETPGGQRSAAEANAGIDSMNAKLVEVHRVRDPKAYAMLYTDSGAFEFPAFNTVRGRAGLEAMARDNFKALNDLKLELTVASRHLAPDHATEFGAFKETWRDSSGALVSEYGRYAEVLKPDSGGWKIHHFFGFEDSTRSQKPTTKP
jgi:ketosteroid isomerase-like protein